MLATQAYRTIVVLDIEDFGRGDRDDSIRVELRRILSVATEETLASGDVPSDAWSASSTGDGLLVLVDPAVSTASVLRGFLDRLPAALSTHNRSAAGPARIRVRVVLHAGHIMLDEHGATGEQINLAFRLLDSDGLRALLRAVPGPLVIGVSEDVYRQVVMQRPLRLNPGTFMPVEVAAKEIRTKAWVHRSDENGALTVQIGKGPPLPSVPSQLPAPPPHFTGREQERRALDGMLRQMPAEGGGTVVLITGTAGTGKTALASHWLVGIRQDYPDGQLYADLRGHAPADPSTSIEVLEGFLRALGLPPEQIQGSSISELSSRFRERTAGRRMLILLDDAISNAQVRPLKPGPGGSVLVVTSRRRLGGLLADGARLLALGTLNDDAATALLSGMFGAERVASEPDSTRKLVQLCGGLPIALCVAGARIAARPRSRIARLVEELIGEQRRLAVLTIEGDISVRSAFDLSYQALPVDAARLYRLAASHPGLDFSGGVAAAAAQLSPEDTNRLLDILVNASLLDDIAEDRYRFHDLLRLHARQVTAADLPTEEGAAVRGMLDWYLASADSADREIMPHRWRQTSAHATSSWQPTFAGTVAALEWLERERLNLLAAVAEAAHRGWHPTAWRLVDSMWGLFLYHKHYREWVASHRIGIESARILGDRHAEALLLRHLGLAFNGLEDFQRAHECFERAAAHYRAVQDRRGEASALCGLGLALHRQGRLGNAIEHFHRASAIQHELRDRRGEALTLADLGRAHDDAGRSRTAIEHLMRAREIFASLPDPYNEARTVAALARAQAGRGQLEIAVEQLEQAMTVLRGVGSPYEQAQALEILGDALRRLGDEETGDRHQRDALAIYQVIASPRARRLDAKLRTAQED